MSLSVLLGLLVGCTMGLTGAGGGILAVPLLMFGLGLSVTTAAPIGLLAVGLSAALGAGIGLRAGTVRYRAALFMAAAGMALAPLGSALAHRLPTHALAWLFAGVMLWVGAKGLLNACRGGPAVRPAVACPCVRASDGRFIWTARCVGHLAAMGASAGLLSGLLGVGGGFVIVPGLQRVSDLPMRSVVATSLAVIALVSLASVGASLYRGHFDLAVGLPFALGAVAGMALGNRLAARWPPGRLKVAFSLVCLGVAVGLVVG